MADSVDRVFGHALNTVNKIRPGSQKPPTTDRLALYGLYKQSMEGDVSVISSRPSSTTTLSGTSGEQVRKEQEKWDAWRANEGMTRTEAKRRYIEKLIETMHQYASGTDEAKELVEELEFVWDQIKNNSQHSSSEHSSPLQHHERSGYVQTGSSGNGGVTSSVAALEGKAGGKSGKGALQVLSPVSQQDEEDAAERELELEAEEEGEEFVDAPVSQVDPNDLQDGSSDAAEGAQVTSTPSRKPQPKPLDPRWRKRIEHSLVRLTTEVAALREQLESRQFIKYQRRHSLWGWIWRLGWWALQLFVADGVILWIVILYMRRKKDPRLEGAVRVLLGDAVAQVQRVTGREVKMPSLPKIPGRKKES